MEIALLIIIILLILSAFFSGSETGLTAVSRAKIHQLKIDGDKRAIIVSELRKDKDGLIGTILLGNNAVNIAASAMATSVAIGIFGDGEGVLYVTIIMTLLVLIFSEVLPKTYAFRNSEKVALAVAPTFKFLVIAFLPITKAVQFIARMTLRMFGMREIKEEGYSIDMLRGAIELHHDAGAVLKHDRDMLGSVLDLAEMEVEEVMIHRKDMETINASNSPQEIAEKAMSSPHTRIPVWKDNPDNIIGILYVKDLVRTLLGGRKAEDIKIEDIMKDPWFIPSTTSLKRQLQAFRSKHTHFALVVDEYGELLGLITLEDILEEIVGQINDEYDIEEYKTRKQPDGSYIVDGDLSIRDLNREMDWDLPDEEAATIAGLIIHDAQLIPNIGQLFHFHGFSFEIIGKKRNQITKIKMKAIEEG